MLLRGALLHQRLAVPRQSIAQFHGLKHGGRYCCKLDAVSH